jgi:hypothetical protein
MAMEAPDSAPDTALYRLTEKRIGYLTVAIGAVAGVTVAFASSVRMGAGILVGSLVACVGFRWLESALDGLVRVTTALPGSVEARVPMGAVLKIVGRYALMGSAVYVTFFVFQVPVVSMLIGLCALGAATIVASLYEIWHPVN